MIVKIPYPLPDKYPVKSTSQEATNQRECTLRFLLSSL